MAPLLREAGITSRYQGATVAALRGFALLGALVLGVVITLALASVGQRTTTDAAGVVNSSSPARSSRSAIEARSLDPGGRFRGSVRQSADRAVTP